MAKIPDITLHIVLEQPERVTLKMVVVAFMAWVTKNNLWLIKYGWPLFTDYTEWR